MSTKTIDIAMAEGYYGQLAENFRKAALRGLRSAALRTQQEIVLRIIPSRSPKPVDRAASGYLGGWRTYPIENGAVVENKETHAAFIEYGVAASNVRITRRMIQMLSEWFVRKGYASAADAKDSVWGLAKKMQQRGIFNNGQGFGILKEAVEKHIPGFIKAEIAREIARL